MTNKKIYFLGPKTSYTDVAIEKLKEQFNLIGYEDVEKPTITAVASELSNLLNDESLAVLPIENSIEGIVKEAIDNISRIEDKSRTVTDIELYAIAKVLDIPWQELSPEKQFNL